MAPVIPGFRILEPIASGASGTVYRAVQEALQRVVALKVLRPGLFDEEQTRARFLREARIQARLSHPNLVALFDAGFAGDVPYLAAEFVDGGSLRETLLAEGALPVASVLHLGRCIAAGLGHAHAAGIVHRDLKPENILLAEAPISGELEAAREVKLTDFGLAKRSAASGTAATADGLLLGTPGYMAPEVLAGEPAGPAADLYALGLVLFEAAAGRRAFTGSDPGALLRAQADGRVPGLLEVRPDLPPELADLVAGLLSRAPGERPASAAEVEGRLASLRSRLASRGVPAGVPEAGSRFAGARAGPAATRRVAVEAAPESRGKTLLVERPERHGRRRGPLVAGAGVLLLAVAGWALWSGARPEKTVDGLPRPGHGHSPSTAPAVLSSRVPRIVGLSCSSRVVKVWFEREAPVDFELCFALPGSATRLSRKVSAGSKTVTLEGVAPSTRVEVPCEAAERSRPLGTTTLAEGPEPDCSLLATGRWGDQRLVVSARGDAVGVLTTRRGGGDARQIVFWHSRDRGETWGPPEFPGWDEESFGSFGLQATAEHFVAGWARKVGSRTEAILARREHASGRWRLEASLPESWPGPSVAVSPDGTAEVITVEGSRRWANDRAWRLSRFEPASPGRIAGRRLSGAPGYVDWHELLRLRNGLLVLEMDEDNPAHTETFRAAFVGEGATRLEPFTIGVLPEFIRQPRAASVEGGAVLATACGGRLLVWWLDADSRRADGPVQPFEKEYSWRQVAVCADGREVLVGAVGYGLFQDVGLPRLRLVRSKGRGAWETVLQRRLPADRLGALQLAAFDDRILLVQILRDTGVAVRSLTRPKSR